MISSEQMIAVRQEPLFASETDTEAPTYSVEQCAVDELKSLIRNELLEHLLSLGLSNGAEEEEQTPIETKEAIRRNHAVQREELRNRESAFIRRYGPELLRRHFANGEEVEPERVEPFLTLVQPDSEESALFRLATQLWSVPVSRGYGRRLRFLVRDRANNRLMGLFALTDPVFNLKARDTWIGWSANDRRKRLVNVMDAHVVGAVPPYSQLLGGKVVAVLMTSQEVCNVFADKYRDSMGVISNERKNARLVLITVSSALGRSSLYNRLKLPGLVHFRRIGVTEGWGHFHIPNRIFQHMRILLQLEQHKYATGYKFGNGPNWRLRVVRECLPRVGLDADLLKHGIAREVFAAPLVEGWAEVLRGELEACDVSRPSAAEIGAAAINRWVIPRAERFPQYAAWTRDMTWNALAGDR